MLFALVLTLAAVPDVRDPFAAVTPVIDDTTARPPVQRYPVDALKVQGLVETASPRALVALPDGSTVVVRVGDVVGAYGGVVRAIGRGRLVVREVVLDPLGERHVLVHTLTPR